MKSDEIRSAYLRFFEERGHTVVPSVPLIPFGDPSVLFTIAGMVPFKAYFTGQAVPPNTRMASCQKCFRTNDIESVGDPTHCTFFEMLGNFSFGDYFKKESIAWGWEFVTQVLKIPKERLWVSVFRDDDVAFDLWRGQGVPVERIVRLDEKDNFWGPAGTSGPCGPCSEIYYDYGAHIGCGKPDCKPGCECKRYTEIWNHVFTEFNQAEDGTLTRLPKPNIDTGMGFERTVAIVQGKSSMYETDLFAPILGRIGEMAGSRYGTSETRDHAMRVLAEHGRAVCFLIADGVMPGKEGRGYVLRRILRRAEYFGQTLADEKPFLVTVAEEVIARMGHIYAELATNRNHILSVIKAEVDSFRKSLPVGRGILLDTVIASREEMKSYYSQFEAAFSEALTSGSHEGLTKAVAAAIDGFLGVCPAWSRSLMVGGRDACGEVFAPLRESLEGIKTFGGSAKMGGPHSLSQLTQKLWAKANTFKETFKQVVGTVSGYEAFILHDTFGFPIDLTREIAASRGLSVDMAAFEREMEKQRERAKAAQKFTAAGGGEAAALTDVPSTEFVGYEKLLYDARVVALVVDGESVGVIHEGQEASIALAATPFYGEMGGQVGDTGEIEGPGGHFMVTDTVHTTGGVVLHRGKVTRGSLAVDDTVRVAVNEARRLDIARNHTATHLLQHALRQVLGKQAQQRGSLVTPERLRFDFTQMVGLSADELQQVQRIVNERIRQDLHVHPETMPYKEAVAAGAIALFDEKYGDTVRVLKVGDPPVSMELCGGTHVSSTGEIGLLHIVSETSIGSGLRRIEAVTGRGAEQHVERLAVERREMAKSLGVSGDDVLDKLKGALESFDQERKQRQASERELARYVAESLLAKAETINGVTVLAARVPSLPPQALREMSDVLRGKLKSGIIVLGTVYDDRPQFLGVVTQDLVTRGYNAGNIIREVAKVTGGGGGGRPNMAQAGGKEKGKLDEALRLVRSLVQGG